MAHIYQSVMLMELFARRGKATRRKLSEALLRWDGSQFEYYDRIVTNYVENETRPEGLVDYPAGARGTGRSDGDPLG